MIPAAKCSPPRRAASPGCEAMEGRLLLTAITWSTTNLLKHDGVLAIPNTAAYVNPTGYAVKLHAGGTHVAAAKLAWTVQGGGIALSAAGVYPTLRLPDGDYTATLSEVTNHGPKPLASAAVNVRDLLVVSMGDSYASGEGNPVVASPTASKVKWAWSPDATANSRNAQAHRSPYASSALMAEAIQRRDPHTAVTYVSVATSGATIAEGLLGPQTKEAYGGGPKVTLPPEVDQVASIVDHHPIGLLTLSIGGNDLGFSSVIEKLFKNGILPFTSDLPAIAAGVDADAAAASKDVAPLGQAIRTKLGVDPSDVLVTEYPDITRDEHGGFSRSIGAKGVFSRANWLVKYTSITPAEARFASETILPKINGFVQTMAATNGWTYVGGVSRAFTDHGYPSTDSWVVNLNESFDDQGDKYGAFHPNRAGHRAIADRYLASLPPGIA